MAKSVHDMHIQNLTEMIRYAENVSECRRKLLIEHFGEVYDSAACRAQPPTACDVCRSRVG